jgi:hypothetical protein
MKRISLLLCGILFSNLSYAQDGVSPITYKSLAIQMSTIESNGDASSATLTSVSSFNGFGSFLDNPASMALSKDSFYSLGWFNQSNDQTNGYLGTQSNSDFSNTTFGNLGLVYKVPTDRGSFVLGGGYSLISLDYNHAYLAAFNSDNSITDLFKQSSSDFNDIAFDAYAIDFRNGTSNEIESIFRVDSRPNGFVGIDQYGRITNDRTIGDFSAFVSSEVQKNLFLGASIGITTGSINYDRKFEEVDEGNLYSDGVIPADGSNPATDIYSIILTNELDTEFYAFSSRLGLVYKVLPFLNLGSSVHFPTKMIISETYFANIDTELDDFTFFENNEFTSEFEYEVIKPAEYKLGATIVDLGGVSISTSLEYIDYGSTEVDLTTSRSINELALNEIAVLQDDEDIINEEINNEFAKVINFRSHAIYQMDNGVQLKGGYSYYPSKRKNTLFQFDESVYSAGISFPFGDYIIADISGQYSSTNNRSLVYEFENNANELISNSISQSNDRLNILVGLKFKF